MTFLSLMNKAIHSFSQFLKHTENNCGFISALLIFFCVGLDIPDWLTIWNTDFQTNFNKYGSVQQIQLARQDFGSVYIILQRMIKKYWPNCGGYLMFGHF